VIYEAEFFAGRSETVTASARVAVPPVCDLLSPQSVLDVGCGQGEWLEEFSKYCPDVFGVDIAAPEPYLRHDLNYPLDLERTFDLVVCLEVGEHLPPAAADVLVDTLSRHSENVLFSAAVPGQEGKGHINCQPHVYWHSKFLARGYLVEDSVRPLIAHPDVSPWYRDNIFLYVRAGGVT
jgi:SAM-dependent methyltransferase